MYDHHNKAGNPGDVIKHVALIAAANVLMQSCGDTFQYADTYAGYAFNPIKPGGEWQNGIGLLHDSKVDVGNPDIRFWRELWDCSYGLEGSVYPGSSIFIRKLSMKNGTRFRARLWDISLAVLTQLKTAYGGNDAEIYERPAVLEDFAGQKPDLLLIDPPDFADVDTALNFFDVVENVILWLPVTTTEGIEIAASTEAFRICRNKNLPIITVNWGGSKSTRGCRLVYQLPSATRLALEQAVADVAAKMRWSCE